MTDDEHPAIDHITEHCSGPSQDWHSERPGPCAEPVVPFSKAWCSVHETERRAYYAKKFRELGGRVSSLRKSQPRSQKARNAWIRKEFARLNRELKAGYRSEQPGPGALPDSESHGEQDLN